MKNKLEGEARFFEARYIEEAYHLASAEYSCSINDLDIEITQKPRRGFFGLGAKNIIIKVKRKFRENNDFKKDYSRNKKYTNNIKIEEINLEANQYSKLQEQKTSKTKNNRFSNDPQILGKEKIFDKFYDCDNEELPNIKIVVKKDRRDILDEIKEKIEELFSYSCFDVFLSKIQFYDENTVYVEFDGPDCMLLIGKKGYRYKALSYILFNWINAKYDLMLRLEIAQFLRNQEEILFKYLEPIIETIKEKAYCKTKPLDGILVHIVLKKLREEFPDKYVAVKTNKKGEKYVLVNEYRNPNQQNA